MRPAKVQRTIEMIEAAGNKVTVRENENEYHTQYWITWDSLEDHFLLKTHGYLGFYKSKSHGHTRFSGGSLHSMSSGTIDFKTYQDLRITVDVYTPTPPNERTAA